MSTPPGNRTANLVILGFVGIMLVGVLTYVLVTGSAESPALYIAGAVGVAAIGAFVVRKNLQKPK